MRLAPRRYLSLLGLLQAAAFMTAIFSIATFFEFLHRYIEMFSHFRLQYLLVSGLLALIFTGFRLRNHAMTMAVITIINAVPVLPWYFGSHASPPTDASTISILHANVLSSNKQYELLTTLIAEQKPDIVFLQEFREGWLEPLSSLAKDYPYTHFVPRDDNFGIAVMSRLPFSDVDQIVSPPLGFPTLVVRIPILDSDLTIVSTHAMPPVGLTRFDARNEQLDDTAQIIAAIRGPAVLIGDLNVSMWSNYYRKLETDAGLRNAGIGFGVIPTWPRFLPVAMIPIDHCLVSDEISVLDLRSGPDIGSDHLPLLVTLAVL